MTDLCSDLPGYTAGGILYLTRTLGAESSPHGLSKLSAAYTVQVEIEPEVHLAQHISAADEDESCQAVGVALQLYDVGHGSRHQQYDKCRDDGHQQHRDSGLVGVLLPLSAANQSRLQPGVGPERHCHSDVQHYDTHQRHEGEHDRERNFVDMIVTACCKLREFFVQIHGGICSWIHIGSEFTLENPRNVPQEAD